jgi:MscS family membrane protein
MVLTLALAFSVPFAVYHFTWRGESALRLPSLARACLLPLAIMLAAYLSGLFIDELNITGPARRYITTALELSGYVALAWLIFAASNQFGHWAAASWAGRKQSFDAGIIRVAVSVLGIALAVGTLVYGANQVGVPLVGILAGLGVGGLAVALAAQPTLENFIGGIMIYADRPVRVGDECKFGDMTGIVEEIGIRSTRLRAKDRSLITIPNADFSKLRLINYSRRDRPLFKTRIGIQYGLNQQQLQGVIEGMREVLKSHWAALPESVEVHCADFGKEAIEIDVLAQLPGTTKIEEPATREDLLLKLFSVIEKSGGTLAARA